MILGLAYSNFLSSMCISCFVVSLLLPFSSISAIIVNCAIISASSGSPFYTLHKLFFYQLFPFFRYNFHTLYLKERFSLRIIFKILISKSNDYSDVSLHFTKLTEQRLVKVDETRRIISEKLRDSFPRRIPTYIRRRRE